MNTYTFKIRETLYGYKYMFFRDGYHVGGGTIKAKTDHEKLNAINEALIRCYDWIDQQPANLRLLTQTYDYYPTLN